MKWYNQTGQLNVFQILLQYGNTKFKSNQGGIMTKMTAEQYEAELKRQQQDPRHNQWGYHGSPKEQIARIKGMSEKEMFEKAYERGNPQYWLNRTRPKKKKAYKLTKKELGE